jgi:hypothetical protein
MRRRFACLTLPMISVLAVGAGWWFVWPTISAKRFVWAIANKDHAAADRMFGRTTEQFLSKIDGKGLWDAQTVQPDWFDPLNGRRRVTIYKVLPPPRPNDILGPRRIGGSGPGSQSQIQESAIVRPWLSRYPRQ